ncbi:MAG: Rrf2 family transcriptional regulator [Planctomycetaceae bacterium]
MFTQTVEYALRVAVRLAATNPQPQTADDLAAATRVPRAYLAKVVQAMVRGGVARSKRGVGGGVVLSNPPEVLTILEIVNAVDPIQRIRTCPLGLESHGTNLCPLHRRFDEALAHVEQAFASTTLAEVLSEPTTSVPLCSFPRGRGKPESSRIEQTAESNTAFAPEL